MKKVVRFLALTLCLCLLSGAALAYTADPNLNEGGVEPICKETVKLTVGLPINPSVADFETNYQTKELERMGNFDLEFEFFADAKEMAQKITLMMMSNPDDLPDVILGSFSMEQLTEWADAEAIIPLNEYYENSTYYIDDSMSTIDLDALKYVTAPDGNIYGMYTLNMSLLNEHENRLFIYKPWLDKLNLEVPTTIEEFYDVLVAFRDKDPNGNGQADEVPMMVDTASLSFAGRTLADFLMTSYVYTNFKGNDYFYIGEDGQLAAAYASDGWRDGLRFLNKLTNEGLFSKLSLSVDQSQLKVIMSAETTTVGVVCGTVANYFGATDPRRTEYYVLPPLEGPDGRTTSWSPSMPSVSMIITSACENPEAAFRFGDLLCSRYISVMTRWGEKGVDWVEPAEGEKSMFDSMGYKALIKAISPWGVEQNQWWAQVGPFIRDYSYGAGMVATDNPYDTQLKLAETLQEYVDLVDKSEAIGKLVHTADEQEVIAEYNAALQNYAKECFALFINGDMSVEADWDTYLAQLESMGLKEVTAAKQSAYDRMNGK